MGKRKKVIMANKLTIKVTKMAFYNGALVYPNEIIKNYKGDSVPSWATLANGKEAPVKKEDEQKVVIPENIAEKCAPCYADGKTPSEADCAECKAKEADADGEEEGEAETEEVVVAGDGGVHEIPADDTAKEEAVAEQTEEALMEEYNALLDEAVDKNILLEDADKKTIVEQIAELKTLLGKE